MKQINAGYLRQRKKLPNYVVLYVFYSALARASGGCSLICQELNSKPIIVE